MPVIALLLALSLGSDPTALSAQASSDEPRLVVLVVVDQLTPEQLERLEPWLEGGFGRFLRGEVWRRAAHLHGVTATGPGHASLSTGFHPASHGIVSNGWPHPDDGSRVYCTGDPEVRNLGRGAEGGGRSPARLLVPALADHFKAASPEARCVGIAGKDRAAILGTGSDADLVLWWDTLVPGFTSSSWYAPALPDWVSAWNDAWALPLSGVEWQDELPADLAAGIGIDERVGEATANGRVFPHRAPTFEERTAPTPAGFTLQPATPLARWIFSSPWIDTFVLELARRAVIEFELGRDEHVDYLFVGLTACDTVGHAYGPESREVTDVLLRTDRALEELFVLLDERVGAGRWLAALSADHGVLPLPEVLQERGIPAGRASFAQAAAKVEELRAELASIHGEDFLLSVGPDGLRFSQARMTALEVEPHRVREFAARFLENELPWVERAFTAAELSTADPESRSDPLLALMARSFHAGRTADVMVAPRPWQILQAEGTDHGSPWPYDREVPLAFLGPGVERRDRYEPCATVDVCPTLLERAGLPVPGGLDGKVLK